MKQNINENCLNRLKWYNEETEDALSIGIQSSVIDDETRTIH